METTWIKLDKNQQAACFRCGEPAAVKQSLDPAAHAGVSVFMLCKDHAKEAGWTGK